MTVHLANSSIKYPEGIVENLLVNVRGSYVFADFVVLTPKFGKESDLWV
jgi:hypothetical protein